MRVQIRHVNPDTGRKDRTEFAMPKGEESKEKPGLVKHKPLYFSSIGFAFGSILSYSKLTDAPSCRDRDKRDIHGPGRFFFSLLQQIKAERSWSMHSMRSQGPKLERSYRATELIFYRVVHMLCRYYASPNPSSPVTGTVEQEQLVILRSVSIVVSYAGRDVCR